MSDVLISRGTEATSPPASPAHARFAEVQRSVLEHYGVDARSRFVQLERPRMRVHVLEAGEGEPILTLHGGDGQGVDWAPLVAHLQDRFHVFSVDRPGFGLSDPFDYRRTDMRRHAADFVLSLLDELGLGSVTLAGGSMGGFFSLCAALDAPERVRNLILLGMPVGFSSVAPMPLRIAGGIPGLTTMMMRGLTKPGTEPRKKQYVEMFNVDISKVPEVYFEMQEAGLAIPGAAKTWAILLRRIVGLRGIHPAMTLAAELPRLPIPVLVVWGGGDMAPVEVGERITATIPNGRFVPMPAIGHFPFLEAPEACAQLITDLVRPAVGGETPEREDIAI